MNEYEMNQMNLAVLEVKRIEFVRDRDTDQLYIRYKLEDGAIVFMPIFAHNKFVTASTLFLS